MDAFIAFLIGMLVSWVMCYLLCSRMFTATRISSSSRKEPRPSDPSDYWKPDDYTPPWTEEEDL